MKIFLVILGLLLCTAPPALALNPDQCLRKISTAIDQGDEKAFAELIDMDEILNQAMDMFLAEMQKPENGTQIAPMLALLFSQARGQGAQAIRNLLRQEAKAFVLNGVSTGAFAGRSFPGRETQGYFAPLFSNASMGRKEIRSVGEPVADENGWFMPFNVHDYGNGQDYALIGRFTDAENAPCLSNIENLDQIFYQIKKEAE